MKPMLQSNTRYGLHEDTYEELGFQSWDGRESCSWRNSELCFRNTDIIIEQNPCIERIEATKFAFYY